MKTLEIFYRPETFEAFYRWNNSQYVSDFWDLLEIKDMVDMKETFEGDLL